MIPLKIISIVSRVLKGGKAALPLKIVKDTITEFKANKESGEGKHDIPMIIGFLLVGVVIFAAVFKGLAPETAEILIELITDVLKEVN